MEASGFIATLLFGVLLGIAIQYFAGWHFARKVEALVPGGLKAWDEYDQKVDHSSPTGRTVTTDGITS